MKQPRKYQIIWEILKTKQKITLEVLPQLVARVKKAVIKEKCNDLGFKLLNDHDSFFLDFQYDSIKKQLKIKLKQKYGLEGIKR